MKSKWLGMLLVMLGLAASASTVMANTVWNLKEDFSLSGPDNSPWAYGYGTDTSNFALGSTDADWGGWGYLHVYRGTNWPGGYPLPGVAVNKDSVAHDPFSAITLQPGDVAMVPADGDVMAIIRWTCPETGTYSVDVLFQGARSDQYRVGVYVDLNSSNLGGTYLSQDGSYNYVNNELELTAGDCLYLLAYNGGSFSLHDWTIVNATITQVPEPATMGLLAVGGLMTLIRRRR